LSRDFCHKSGEFTVHSRVSRGPRALEGQSHDLSRVGIDYVHIHVTCDHVVIMALTDWGLGDDVMDHVTLVFTHPSRLPDHLNLRFRV
jgi:hypothetical protein